MNTVAFPANGWEDQEYAEVSCLQKKLTARQKRGVLVIKIKFARKTLNFANGAINFRVQEVDDPAKIVPSKIVLVVDPSNSMADKINRLRNGMRSFLEQLKARWSTYS